MKKTFLFLLLFIKLLNAMRPHELLAKFNELTAEKRRITSNLNIIQLTIIDLKRKGGTPSEQMEEKVRFLKKQFVEVQNNIMKLRRYFFNGVPLLKVSLDSRHSY